MVMAETQYRQSLFAILHTLACMGWIRQDSAACVSLSSIDLSKSAGAATTMAARLAPVRRGENDTYRLV
jgi:hypothetical protein